MLQNRSGNLFTSLWINVAKYAGFAQIIAFSLVLCVSRQSSADPLEVLALTSPQKNMTCKKDSDSFVAGRLRNGEFISFAKDLSLLKGKKRLARTADELRRLLRMERQLKRKRSRAVAICKQIENLARGKAGINCSRWDLNGDGIVNEIDLAMLLGRFGSRLPAYDVDGDGIVGLSELIALLACYSSTTQPPPPSPTATLSPSATATHTPTPAGTRTPSPTPTATNTPSRTPSPSATPTMTATNTPSPSATHTPTPTSVPETPQPPIVTNGDWDLDFSARIVAHPGWRVTQVNKPRLFRLAVVHEDDYERDVPLTYTIYRSPAHGTVTGTAPNLIYVPDPGFVGEDSMQFYASDGSATSNIATVYFRVLAEYVPPIGVPMPSFGISETHSTYAGQRFDFDQDGLLEPGEEYRIGPNGPYTHYIDTEHPNRSDAGNPYGTVDRPRASYPSGVILPAGSVVEIHGTNLRSGGDVLIKGQGTRQKPVFIRGGNIENMPRFSDKISVYSVEDSNGDGQQNDVLASYMIFEYLSVPKLDIYGPAQYLAVRDVEVTGGGGTSVGGRSVAKTASNILFLRLNAHDTGNWRFNADQDNGYNIVSTHANSIWHLDSQATRAQSNGFMVNGSAVTTHHIYFGRCEAWQNKQTAFGLKSARDVIYSENVSHDSAPRAEFPAGHPSDWGAGFGLQYNPGYVYYLHNTIYNSSMGISMGSGGNPDPTFEAPQADQRVFIVRNNIFAIRRMNEWNGADQGGMDAGDAFSNVSAVRMAGMAHRYLIGNTISGAVTGINSVSSITLHAQNNIVSNITDPRGHHFLAVQTGGILTRLIERNMFFQPGSSAQFGWDNGHSSLATFQARSASCSTCSEADPRFRNAATNNLELAANSPAIDAGVLDTVYQEFESRYGLSIRTDDGRPDLGAFEF